MGRIEKSIEIKAPPEKVWELLALDRLPEWNEEYGNVKYTSELRNPEDKYRVGASSHTNIKGAGAIDFKITESLKNEEGTQFAYVMTYQLPWGSLGKFIGKIGQGMLEKEAEKSLEKLKSILEK